LTAVSALGSLASGRAAIAKTINNANNKKMKVLQWVKECFLNPIEKVMDYI